MLKKTKKRIVLIMFLSTLFVCALPFFINKSLGAIYNVESNFSSDDSNVVINYSKDGTSPSLNFDISLKEGKNYSYYLITKFKPTSIELPLESGNYKLVLKSSNDNSVFTIVSEKNITVNNLNTDLVFVNAGTVSKSKVYYKLVLYANNVEQDIRVKNISGNFSVNVYTGSIETVGSTTNFAYTGSSHSYTVPTNGKYLIELWGASGAPFAYSPPGKGGYTKGIVSLNAGNILYFYVGGTGNVDNGVSCIVGLGGWNGGGNGGSSSICPETPPGAGGGGATDVRFGGTALSNRIMVAGAGGTRGYNGIRGDAGGLIGYTAGAHSSASQLSTGGTQSSGGESSNFGGDCGSSGSLGQGGVGQNALSYYDINYGTRIVHAGDGGGGGYYGGGGSGNKDMSGTGGGSSYISGHGGCTTHSSGKTFTDTLMIDGRGYKWTTSAGSLQQMPNPLGGYYESGIGHVGSGYAKVSTVINITSNSVYTWSKNPVKAILTVNYVDETGNKLKPSDVSEFLVDETYVTSVPTSFSNYNNYELVSIPVNATGILPREGTTVNYIYRLKSSNVVVHHYFEGTTTSIEGGSDQILSGKVTQPYTTSAKSIDKYALVATPSNANGIYKLNIEIVTYYYRLRNEASVNVIHKLDSDLSILDEATINGYVGNPYLTDARTYENYELKTTPSNASGIFEDENEDVIYIYTLKPGGNVIVHHYLEGTTTSIDGGSDETLTGKVTESYTTSAKSIEKYSLVTTPSNKNGAFTLEEQIVTYYYRLRSSASVNVIHKLDTGDTLDSNVIRGYEGDPYTTTSKTYANYELKTTPSNANGIYEEENEDVIYIYTLKSGGVITVHHYLEGTTTSIEGGSDQTLTGKITESYTTSAITNEDYILVSTPSNSNGTFTLEEQIVTYYYRVKVPSNVAVIYKTESGNILNRDDFVGVIGSEYETEEKDFENYILTEVPSNKNGTYTEEPQEVVYVYALKEGAKVTVHHYIKDTTTTVSDDVVLTGKITEPYISKSVSIESYKLIETPSNAIGTFTNEEQTVTYYYEVKTPTIIEIVYVDTSGKILGEKKEDGYIGDEYTSEEKKFENYELLNVSDNWHGTLEENNEKVYYTYSLVQNPKTGIGNTLWISLTVIILGIFTYLYVSKKQIFNI